MNADQKFAEAIVEVADRDEVRCSFCFGFLGGKTAQHQPSCVVPKVRDFLIAG